ncbi:MAG: hypothetical protein J6V30_00520 [Paludibacteraceae bacterium]|nr:hypothetical protein [Paludibacteraceae bacterium]
MKKYFFRIGMCLTTILLLFGLFSVSAESTIYRMNVYQKDGQKIQFEVSGIDSIQFDTVCVEKGYEYIDLGLPSGLKWATRNVGASSPEDFGDYYAWGDTIVREKYIPGEYYYEKYDSIFSFEDVVKTKVEGNWRMPTEEEMEELEKKCTWKWITQNGVNGYKVIGPNGNFIFLPAAGYRSRDELSGDGTSGCYWSSSSHKDEEGNEDFNYAHYLSFYSDLVRVSYYNRCNGFTIRGVWQKKESESESEGGSEE